MSTTPALKRRRQQLVSEMDAVISRAEHFKRDFSAADIEKMNAAKTEIADIDFELRKAEERAKVDPIAQDVRNGGNGFGGSGIGHDYGSAARTSSRGGTYNPESRNSYFLDLYQSRHGDWDARERLQRHGDEFRDSARNSDQKEIRALASNQATNGGEFAPPLWLVEDYVTFARPARAVADILNGQKLPAGTPVINVPAISAGTATAVQNGQNTPLQASNATTGSVNGNVCTIAGYQTFSQQQIDQSPLGGGFDKLILDDLAADYARALGAYVITGTGANGQPFGLLNAAGQQAVVAFTAATPALTGPNSLRAKIAAQTSAIQTSVFASPTALIMHPRRWQWACEQIDTTNRPLIASDAAGPQNAGGLVQNGNESGHVGWLSNKPVIVDPAIPTNLGAGTNEDVVLVIRATDSVLYEDAPRVDVFDQPGASTLTLMARLYGYMALVHRRPLSIAKISGTGLVTPTF